MEIMRIEFLNMFPNNVIIPFPSHRPVLLNMSKVRANSTVGRVIPKVPFKACLRRQCGLLGKVSGKDCVGVSSGLQQIHVKGMSGAGGRRIYAWNTHSIWMNVRHQDWEFPLSIITVGLRETQDELTGQAAEAHQGGKTHGIHGAIWYTLRRRKPY